MDKSLIQKNFELVSNLEPDQKLIVVNNKLELDTRYLQSVNRFVDGSNRYQVLLCVQSTLTNAIYNYNYLFDKKDYEKFLKGLKTLSSTYVDQDFSELETTISQLESFLKKKFLHMRFYRNFCENYKDFTWLPQRFEKWYRKQCRIQKQN
jgi:hypothetical protein